MHLDFYKMSVVSYPQNWENNELSTIYNTVEVKTTLEISILFQLSISDDAQDYTGH